MQVQVRFQSKTLPIELPSDASDISFLKSEISRATSVPPEQQKIIWKGKPLLDLTQLVPGTKLLLLANQGAAQASLGAAARSRNVRSIPNPGYMTAPPHSNIVAMGLPAGAPESHPYQTDVMHTNYIMVRDEKGLEVKMIFESEGFFFQNNESGDRIMFENVYGVGTVPIGDGKYFAILLDTKYGKKWFYFLPNQYLRFVPQLIARNV